MVTFEECHRHFVERGGQEAVRIYDEWRTREDLQRAGVIDFVRSATHEHLDHLTEKDFNHVRRTTAHPIGTIHPDRNPEDAAAVALIADAASPWAMVQLFHRYIEEKGHIPTWQAWSGWLRDERPELLWDDWKRQTGFDSANAATQVQIRKGVAWRLGNTYYSALRELEIFIRLRAQGLSVKYHLLADALFAADFWFGDRIGSVYIPSVYKEREEGGRKIRPEAIFPKDVFNCRNFRIEKQRVQGHYWPVKDSIIEEMSAYFRNVGNPQDRVQ